MPTIHNTFGLLYIGTCVGCVLYGVACLQAWGYFRAYATNDHWLIKSAVTTVIICETVQMALWSASFYEYCVAGHGSTVLGLETPVQPLTQIQWFFAGAIGIIVQMMDPSAQFVLFTQPRMVVLSTVINSTGALCDLAISGTMIFYLQRSKTGIRKSTNMINRMILFTFSAGIPASVFAVLALVFVTRTHCYTCSSTCFVIYTNSLLVTLNGRMYIVEGPNPRVDFRIPGSHPRPERRRGGGRKPPSIPLVSIALEKTMENAPEGEVQKPTGTVVPTADIEMGSRNAKED
ncbi:hypothetical protein PM082_006015 [Marasmius tenuissimus]|nr:hypothetical protein PM082_006015 [Marasmius tenuissimus]